MIQSLLAVIFCLSSLSFADTSIVPTNIFECEDGFDFVIRGSQAQVGNQKLSMHDDGADSIRVFTNDHATLIIPVSLLVFGSGWATSYDQGYVESMDGVRGTNHSQCKVIGSQG